MTIGQRIAQKRKELGLSQEALGDQLGLSRQAIYKWESDTALPEIEKLVALSKIFAVPVGWLLGVEDEPAAEQEDAAGEEGAELTETQLRMVEEIVSRYLAAQPKAKPRRRWIGVVAALVILVVGVHLFSRLDQLSSQYNNLQNSVGNLNWSVNNQIGSIAGRVEEILKSQNDLTADYGTEIADADLAKNTITFSLRAVPKTFVDGMSAVFLGNSGTGPVEFPAMLSAGGVFSAEATLELTDMISLSVVFINPDGTRQTQLLDTYEYLYSGSIPEMSIDALHSYTVVKDGSVRLLGEYTTVRETGAKELCGQAARVEHIRVGVFVDQKLVAWAEECSQPDSYRGDWEGWRFFRLPDAEIKLERGERLQVAALVTDNFGRQFMAGDIPLVLEYDANGDAELTYPSDATYDSDPAGWMLE